jgi:hypothetical protein
LAGRSYCLGRNLRKPLISLVARLEEFRGLGAKAKFRKQLEEGWEQSEEISVKSKIDSFLPLASDVPEADVVDAFKVRKLKTHLVKSAHCWMSRPTSELPLYRRKAREGELHRPLSVPIIQQLA